MRRAVLALAVLAAIAGCSTVAFAAGLGVTARPLTSVAAASTVPASSCSATPSQDTWLEGDKPGKKHGGDAALLVAADDGGKNPATARALVQFDLSCLPAGAAIESATLKLYLASAPAGSRTYGVHRITSSWSDSSASWNDQPSFGPAGSTASASGGWLSWNVTPDVAAGAGDGWAILDENESYGSATGGLDSVEGANAPTLTIEYWP